MRYLRWNGHPTIDLLADNDFNDLRKSLDAEMKRLQSKGIGSKKMPGQQDEEMLWLKGLLGDTNPPCLALTWEDSRNIKCLLLPRPHLMEKKVSSFADFIGIKPVGDRV